MMIMFLIAILFALFESLRRARIDNKCNTRGKMDLGFLVHTWCTITENSIFFLLFEFFISCIYYFPLIITLVYVDTDYFFSFIGITLSIKYKPDFLFPTHQKYAAHIFLLLSNAIFLWHKSPQKSLLSPNYYDLFCTKRKSIIWERKIMVRRANPFLWIILSFIQIRMNELITVYTQSMYKNRVKDNKILFLKFLLFGRLVLDDEIQSRKIESNTNIFNFPSPYSADSPRALEIEPYFQNISVVLYLIFI